MQFTTYYVTQRAAAGRFDADAAALVHLINDTGAGNGDNRSWNAMRARLDATLDAETQRQLGITIESVDCEADDD